MRASSLATPTPSLPLRSRSLPRCSARWPNWTRQQVNKDTLATKLSDLAKLAEQNRALAALRDLLEKQAQDAAARA